MKELTGALLMGLICCLSSGRQLPGTRSPKTSPEGSDSLKCCRETRHLIHDIFNGDTISLFEEVVIDSQEVDWTSILEDSVFDGEDREAIRQQLRRHWWNHWNAVLTGSGIHLVQGRIPMGPTGQQATRRGVYSLGYPIFLRDYTRCLFYKEYRVGRYEASGCLLLYKKVGKHWVILKAFMDWEA